VRNPPILPGCPRYRPRHAPRDAPAGCAWEDAALAALLEARYVDMCTRVIEA